MAVCSTTLEGSLNVGRAVLLLGPESFVVEAQPIKPRQEACALSGLAMCSSTTAGTITTNPTANRFQEDEALAILFALAA